MGRGDGKGDLTSGPSNCQVRWSKNSHSNSQERLKRRLAKDVLGRDRVGPRGLQGLALVNSNRCVQVRCGAVRCGAVRLGGGVGSGLVPPPNSPKQEFIWHKVEAKPRWTCGVRDCRIDGNWNTGSLEQVADFKC